MVQHILDVQPGVGHRQQALEQVHEGRREAWAVVLMEAPVPEVGALVPVTLREGAEHAVTSVWLFVWRKSSNDGEENDPERPHIGSAQVVAAAVRAVELRGHAVRSAFGTAEDGVVGTGTAEIHYLEVEAGVDEDVGQLQVQVGYAAGVDVADAQHRLQTHTLAFVFLEPSCLLEHSPQFSLRAEFLQDLALLGRAVPALQLYIPLSDLFRRLS